jgi:hypothetical protein
MIRALVGIFGTTFAWIFVLRRRVDRPAFLRAKARTVQGAI